MRSTYLIATTLLTALELGAQTTPAPVQATTVLTFKADGSDAPNDLTGSLGGRLVFYVTDSDVRVYNRATRVTSVVTNGNYTYVASSQAGNRLALLRPVEGSGPARSRNQMVWTLTVNPQTGTASGEPRRVSMLPAETPRFSPDGASIAFITKGAPQRMVVIPGAGGPERVLFEGGDPQGPVRWSPDGRWVYFSQPTRERQGASVVSRVSIDGGTPAVLTPPLDIAEPGLTPDGKYIAGIARASLERPVVNLYTPDKKEAGSVLIGNLPKGEPGAFAWSGDGLHMLVGMFAADLSLHVRGLNGSADRAIQFGDHFLRVPSISPDGRQLALTLSGDTSFANMTIMNIDGSDRRTLAQSIAPGDLETEPLWSPDGRFFVFSAEARHSLYVAEAATGKTTKVGSSETWVGDLRWRADSRTILYTRQDGTGPASKKSIRETTLNGQDRLVRDFTSLFPANDNATGAGRFLNDTTVVVFRLGMTIGAGGSARKLFEPMSSASRIGPGISPDGRWLALADTSRKSVELLSTDGQTRRTLKFPAAAQNGFRLRFINDGTALLVFTDASPAGPETAYLVPIDGRAAHPVVTLGEGEQFNDVSLSPDGRSVLYSKFGPISAKLLDIDLGAALRTPDRR